MSGIEDDLEDFDLFATPIDEYYGPSIGSEITPHLILHYRTDRGVGSHKGGGVPNPDNFAHYTLSNIVPDPRPRAPYTIEQIEVSVLIMS